MRMRMTGVVLALTAAMAVSPAAAQKRQRDLVTHDEIMASAQSTTDAYTALKALRPHFFQEPRTTRDFRSAAAKYILMVVIGSSRDWGVEALQGMKADKIGEARYLPPDKAQSEFGQQANGGALVIKLWTGADSTAKKPTR